MAVQSEVLKLDLKRQNSFTSICISFRAIAVLKSISPSAFVFRCRCSALPHTITSLKALRPFSTINPTASCFYAQAVSLSILPLTLERRTTRDAANSEENIINFFRRRKFYASMQSWEFFFSSSDHFSYMIHRSVPHSLHSIVKVSFVRNFVSKENISAGFFPRICVFIFFKHEWKFSNLLSTDNPQCLSSSFIIISKELMCIYEEKEIHVHKA